MKFSLPDLAKGGVDQIYFSLGEIGIPVGYKAGIGGSFLVLFYFVCCIPPLFLFLRDPIDNL